MNDATRTLELNQAAKLREIGVKILATASEIEARYDAGAGHEAPVLPRHSCHVYAAAYNADDSGLRMPSYARMMITPELLDQVITLQAMCLANGKATASALLGPEYWGPKNYAIGYRLHNHLLSVNGSSFYFESSIMDSDEVIQTERIAVDSLIERMRSGTGPFYVAENIDELKNVIRSHEGDLKKSSVRLSSEGQEFQERVLDVAETARAMGPGIYGHFLSRVATECRRREVACLTYLVPGDAHRVLIGGENRSVSEIRANYLERATATNSPAYRGSDIDALYARVFDELQAAEEMGGPVELEYVAWMDALVEACDRKCSELAIRHQPRQSAPAPGMG